MLIEFLNIIRSKWMYRSSLNVVTVLRAVEHLHSRSTADILIRDVLLRRRPAAYTRVGQGVSRAMYIASVVCIQCDMHRMLVGGDGGGRIQSMQL